MYIRNLKTSMAGTSNEEGNNDRDLNQTATANYRRGQSKGEE